MLSKNKHIKQKIPFSYHLFLSVGFDLSILRAENISFEKESKQKYCHSCQWQDNNQEFLKIFLRLDFNFTFVPFELGICSFNCV